MRSHSRRRPGFSLVEAMTALVITGITASALMLSAVSSTDTADEAVRDFIAQGIAQTLMDEISGMRYMEGGGDPFQVSLSAGSDELAAPGRSIYDDVDDYHGIRNQPPKDRGGQNWGNDNGEGTTSARDANFAVRSNFFSRWKSEIDVFYVQEGAWLTPLPNGNVSSYRTAQVRVIYVDPRRGNQELARNSRTFAYVAP